jgi:hypothetical protein
MDSIVTAMVSEQQAQGEGAGSAAPQSAATSNIDNDFLERFNRLSQKEAALRKRDQEIRAERDSWKSKVDRLEKLERLKQEDPEALLSEFGLDYDKLTERRLSSLGSEPERELKTLKEELTSLKQMLAKKDEDAQSEATGKALQQAHADVRALCEREEYELIGTFEDYDLVLDTAAEYFKATGKLISLEDAAKHVEGHLEKKLERILAAKKVAARNQPKPDPESSGIQGGSEPQESRGLSASMATSSKPSVAFSEDDLRQAALRALRGN